MALINCKKCGCQMSDKSEACPVCGTPVEANVDEHNNTQEVETTPPPLEPTTQQNDNKVPQTKRPEPVSPENNPPTPPTPAPSQPKPEQPKEKGKTGLIIGIVAGVIVIAAIIAVFVMKSNKEQDLSEQQAEYELQMQEQQAQHEAELEEQRQQQKAQQNKLKGYEWLEGVWAGTDEYGSFGRVIVTDSYFQVVNSNMDDASDHVEDMPKQDYELRTWQNAYDGYDDDGEVFGFSDIIGVDVEKQCIYIIQGEYSAITLHKINASSFESAVYEANHNYPAENDQDMSNESYQQNDSNGSRFVVIDGSELRLRLGPSTSSDTFKWPDGTNRHPNVGDKFKYLGESGDFYKIDFNGNEVWVSKQYTHIESASLLFDLLGKDARNYDFTENDLATLSAKDLTYLRNSVYAKHGYVFKSQELNDYFSQFVWYHPDSSVTDAVLNNTEKTNVEFIKNYQRQNGKTYIPQ